MTSVAVITGVSRGIGAATSLLMAKNESSLCINYLNNQAAAEEIIQQAKSEGVAAIAVPADVSGE